MAKEVAKNAGPVPTVTGTVDRKGPSDFDKFVAANMDKAVIGTPGAEGDGVVAGGAPPPPSAVELPAGLSPEHRAQIEGVIAARTREGVARVASPSPAAEPMTTERVRHAVAQPPNVGQPGAIPSQPFAKEAGQPRAWSPMDQFAPSTPMSVLEEAQYKNSQLPTAPTSGSGGALTDVRPHPQTPQVYVEAYNILRALVAGNWILPGGKIGEVNGLLPRLKLEIEESPNGLPNAPAASRPDPGTAPVTAAGGRTEAK